MLVTGVQADALTGYTWKYSNNISSGKLKVFPISIDKSYLEIQLLLSSSPKKKYNFGRILNASKTVFELHFTQCVKYDNHHEHFGSQEKQMWRIATTIDCFKHKTRIV